MLVKSEKSRGFVVLYRWRLKPGLESQFIAAWARVTQRFHQFYGSLGARLHRGSDGLWYSYAQWPSAEQREEAFKAFTSSVDPEASAMMREAIAEFLPEVQLEIAADFLASSPWTATGPSLAVQVIGPNREGP